MRGMINLKKNHGITYTRFFSLYKWHFTDKVYILFFFAGVLVLMELQIGNYIGIRLVKELPEQNFFNWYFSGIEMIGFLRTENTILS